MFLETERTETPTNLKRRARTVSRWDGRAAGQGGGADDWVLLPQGPVHVHVLQGWAEVPAAV